MGVHAQRLASNQAAWNAARRLALFSYTALSAEAGIPINRATRLVRGWVRAGVVEALGKAGTNKLMFRVCRELDEAPAMPRAQTAEGNMWRAMRGLRNAFSPIDIATHATTD